MCVVEGMGSKVPRMRVAKAEERMSVVARVEVREGEEGGIVGSVGEVLRF